MSGVGLNPSTKQILETANKLNRAPDFPYSLVQPVRELDDIANDLIKNGPKVDKQLDFLKSPVSSKTEYLPN